MSEFQSSGVVPQWDLADRMRKSLRESGTSVQEMADYLGVARNTVSTWINGRIEPSVQTTRLWAIRCGVDYGWLAGDAHRPARRRVLMTTGGESRMLGNLTPFAQVAGDWGLAA